MKINKKELLIELKDFTKAVCLNAPCCDECPFCFTPMGCDHPMCLLTDIKIILTQDASFLQEKAHPSYWEINDIM